MEARWKEGAGVRGLSAAAAAAELARIGKAHGAIRPAVVVDEARPADAPLHPAFTWDDGRAAEAWRREEARTLIRSVEFVDTTGAGERAVPAFCSVVAADAAPQYMAVAEVVADAALLASAQRSLQAQIRGLRGTLAGLSWLAKTRAPEHAAIAEGIDALEAAVSRLQSAA